MGGVEVKCSLFSFLDLIDSWKLSLHFVTITARFTKSFKTLSVSIRSERSVQYQQSLAGGFLSLTEKHRG